MSLDRPAAETDRAVSTVAATVLLVGLTVVAASLVGSLALGQATALTGTPPAAAFSLDADAGSDRIRLTHEGGDAVDVRALRVVVQVDGEPLAHQPPLPFFAAEGFRGGPTGPFNPSTDPAWRVGEAASFRVAGTNDPALTAGATVTVELFHDETRFASLTTTVSG